MTSHEQTKRKSCLAPLARNNPLLMNEQFEEYSRKSLDLPKEQIGDFMDELFVFALGNDIEETPPMPESFA